MPLLLKENVSLFSKISLRSLHMCETIIIHSIRDREREHDSSVLATIALANADFLFGL